MTPIDRPEVADIRVTSADDNPGLMTSVIWLHPSEHGVSAKEMAVEIAARLAGIGILDRASVSVTGAAGRGRASVEVVCRGGRP